MKNRNRYIALVCAALCLFALLFAASPARAEVAYKPQLSGVDDKALVKDLKASSYLFQFEEKKPLSYDALDRRAKDDMQRLRDVMMAHAYYGADIRYTITKASAEKKNEADKKAKPSFDGYLVDVTVSTGPLFKMKRYALAWQNKSGRKIAAPKGLSFDGILQGAAGMDATPAVVLDVERRILDKLKANGYPLPEVEARNLTIDHATQQAEATLVMIPGRAAVFAKTRTAGHNNVDEDFVRRRIAWKDGDTFNIDKVVTTRQAMLKTGLFSSVDVMLEAKEGAPTVPVTINMTERKPRTIGTGLSYSTSQSIAGKVFWEHRNLGGGGEKLRLEADAGINRYGIGGRFTKPDFGGTTKRSLQLSLGFKQEFLDSYDKTSYGASARVDHAFNDRLTGKLGLTLEFSQIKENNQPEDDFILLSIPSALSYDSSDDVLDPTKGVRASLDVVPYVSVNEADESFMSTELSGSHYWSLREDHKIIFANRAKLGAIWGQGVSDIPADKRLYSGGGGSVRGYGYQLVSPLDANNDPTGGKYQVEVGSEMRFRVSDTVGLVTFVEGGRVTEDLSITGDERFLWAAGVGARYYTAVGPLRVDIAVPVNGRDKDDMFQLYLSLGQAF